MAGLFGGTSTTSTASVFGGSAAKTTPATSVFGVATTTTTSASVFGGAATTTAGDDNKIEVTASLLAITSQPSTTIVGAAMSNVVVRANDALGNRDLDFAGDVEVTSTGSLVGSPVIVAASSGTATSFGTTVVAVCVLCVNIRILCKEWFPH